MSEYFLIAKITSVYGRNGFVKIAQITDYPDRFFELENVYINFFGSMKKFTVEEVKKAKDFFTFKFKYFESVDDVQVLIGKDLYVIEKDLIQLPEDHFFIHDLIDCIVLKNNKEIGKIVQVLNSPANDVIVIEDFSGNEILIPAVKEFIESFDPDKKKLILKPGEDFYENED